MSFAARRLLLLGTRVGSEALPYSETVLALTPQIYWPLNETSGTTADNAEGTVAYDGVSSRVQYTRRFYKTRGYNFNTSRVNIYSATFNTNFNRAEGSISLWFRPITKANWTPSLTGRILNIAADDNNRFVVQISTTGILEVLRISGAVVKMVTHDFSVTKPIAWQAIVITYSIANDQLKLFVNGTQSGTTQTGLTAFVGALDSTKCCIGTQDTSNTLPLIDVCVSNLAIWNRVITPQEITTYSTAPSGPVVSLTHSIKKSWDIFSLFGITGSSLACFAYDVDGDGEKEFVGNIGRRGRFVAVKQNGTILWDNTISNTQTEPARYPQIRNGVMYYAELNKVYAITLSTGATLFNKTIAAFAATPTWTIMNQASIGLVVAADNKMEVLDYTTGNSIGGNFPKTLPWNVMEQNLGIGDIDNDGHDEIIVNNNLGNILIIDHNGTDLGTITSSHSHVDLYEVFDINGDGVKEIICVVDDNNTSTQVAGEGDELAVYNSVGTQLDKYSAAVIGGIQHHCYNWPNGGRVAFSLESDTAHTLTMLDANLNEIWKVDVGTPYEGDQFFIMDVDGDGIPELCFSTEVFSQTAGFRVYDYHGNPKLFFSVDNPTEADDIVDARGAVEPKSLVNKGQGPAPMVVDDLIQFTLRTTDNTGHEVIYWHQWQ